MAAAASFLARPRRISRTAAALQASADKIRVATASQFSRITSGNMVTVTVRIQNETTTVAIATNPQIRTNLPADIRPAIELPDQSVRRSRLPRASTAGTG